MATRLRPLFVLPFSFNAQQAHQLILNEVKSAIVAGVHEIVHFSPALAICDILGVFLHGPVVDDFELFTSFHPGLVLQVAEHGHQSLVLFENLGRWLFFKFHELLSVHHVVVRLVEIVELLV